MRIQLIQNSNLHQSIFKSCLRSYTKDVSKYPISTQIAIGLIDEKDLNRKPIYMHSADIPVYTATNMFRSDLDWDYLVYLADENFKNKDKVNVYSLAASDGSEAYTFVMSVMDKLNSSKHSKYFPVYASDIDREVIENAQKGLINLSHRDFGRFSKYLIFNKEYFEYIGNPASINNNNESNFYDYRCYKPVSKLREAVKFEQADILEQLTKIKDNGNSIIMCRNVFPYLGKAYTLKIVQKIQEMLKPNSLFVIGDFDSNSNIEKLLLNANFEKRRHNIFCKI